MSENTKTPRTDAVVRQLRDSDASLVRCRDAMTGIAVFLELETQSLNAELAEAREERDAFRRERDAILGGIKRKFDNPDWVVFSEMELRGGSFVVALALAARKADPENLARLTNAFPEIFERYDALAGAVPIPTNFGPSDG